MAYMERYTWEDALIQAQKEGRIGNGGLLLGLKLASAITWRPKRGKEPGLYWKNQDAFDAVGVSRATYFRNKGELFDAGYLTMVKNNLVPSIPESQSETISTLTQSQSETPETAHSLNVRLSESQSETPESQSETPYSVDTYSVDTCSEGTASATAPAAGTEELREGPTEDTPSLKDSGRKQDSSKGSVEGEPQSHIETFSTLTLLDEGQTLRHCDDLGVEAVYNEDGNMNYGKTAERHGVAEAFRWEMARRLRAKMVAKHMDVLALALKGAITIDTNNEEEDAAWL